MGRTKKKKRGSEAKSGKHASLSHAHRKKHHKPYRIRHVGLIVSALVVGLASSFQIGVYYGRSTNPSFPQTAVDQLRQNRAIGIVKSSYGLSFAYSTDAITVSATQKTDDGVSTVDSADLRLNKELVATTLKVKTGAAPASEAVSRIEYKLNPDQSAFQAAKESAGEEASEHEVAAGMFSVTPDSTFDVDVLTETEERLGGITTVKRVYQHTPKFGTDNAKSYSVQWVGVADNRAFSLHLQGLVGDSSIPGVFQPVFDSLSFVSGNDSSGVLGINTGTFSLTDTVSAQAELDSKYIIDSITPAVVKIYHTVCGVLMVENTPIGGEGCEVMTGSGFFVSSDGLIATNGHVVVFDAEDAFINFMISNPGVLYSFLQGYGLSDSQIIQVSNNPAAMASIIAEVYELPAGALRFEQESHTYFVALGDEPVEIRDRADVLGMRNKEDTDKLKKAEFIAADYAAKDLFVAHSGDEAGFSSSDVALLKLHMSNTPFIRLHKDQVTQNMGISIIGYPGDADNQLTDNSKLSLTVTNGNISAIRDAAGGKYKLYQSDADASQGNSGGPVVSASGHVIGLLTYRFKNSTNVDAAKSYIRAIEDLESLAEEKDQPFTTAGTVQQDWEKGLELFSTNRFSKSLIEFEKVSSAYPAHRLVSKYIADAEKGIAEGRDVKDFPILLVGAGVIALIGVAGGIVLAVRHRGHHQAYKTNFPTGSGGGTPPAAPGGPSSTSFVNSPTQTIAPGGMPPGVPPAAQQQTTQPAQQPTLQSPQQQKIIQPQKDPNTGSPPQNLVQ